MKTLATPREAFKIINVSEPQGYRLIREGILPAVRVGRQYRIDLDVLEQWIRSGGQSYEGGWRKESVVN